MSGPIHLQALDKLGIKEIHAGGVSSKASTAQIILNFQALNKLLGIKHIKLMYKQRHQHLSLTHRCNDKKDTEVSKDEKIDLKIPLP